MLELVDGDSTAFETFWPHYAINYSGANVERTWLFVFDGNWRRISAIGFGRFFGCITERFIYCFRLRRGRTLHEIQEWSFAHDV